MEIAAKIGIGITTTPNRMARYDECIANIKQYTQQSFALYTHIDDEYRGIAQAKNKCLYNLFELFKCDIVYLFDDDCFPIKFGWDKFMPDRHVLLLNHKLHKRSNTYQSHRFNYDVFDECGGVFMSVTRKEWMRVGYFDNNYKSYGYEHAGYSQRIYKAGLNPHPYMMPKGLNNLLFAHDYSDKKIESSLSKIKKELFLEHNWNIFLTEKQGTQIYKPYEDSIQTNISFKTSEVS